MLFLYLIATKRLVRVVLKHPKKSMVDLALLQVALWSQKRARSPNNPVVWDYHVILVLRPKINESNPGPHRVAWVYDFDTKLSNPCRLQGP